MSESVGVLYRGPFQTRRLRLILDAVEHLDRPISFTWLDPKKSGASSPRFFSRFVSERSSIREFAHLAGDMMSMPSLARMLRHERKHEHDLAVAIGFTALGPAQLMGAQKLVWCINGIPEERQLYDTGKKADVAVQAMWSSARIGKAPDATITVSTRMSELVTERIGQSKTMELPTAVDREVFRPGDKSGPPLLAYVGSGAPWQNLGYLREVWAEVARLHESATFLVVSKDARAKQAIADIAPERAEIVAGKDPGHVAELTNGARLGFLIREPHVVNAVSSPTKFGEYVASRTGVVTTDIGWEPADMVQRTGCGLLVDWADSPKAAAKVIVDELKADDGENLRKGCDRAADELDRDTWIHRVGEQLGDLVA